MDFDFERGTEVGVARDGTLHIRSDDGSFSLVPTHATIAAMPPAAPAEMWAWWCASALCTCVGVLVLLATTSIDANDWSPRGQIVTLAGLAVASIGMVIASVKIWRASRVSRSERDSVLSAVRSLTDLSLTRRQARRFLVSRTHFLVSPDGTAWAVHEGVLFRGCRMT